MQFHLSVLLLGSCCEEKPLTAILRTDQSQLYVAWRTRLILNNGLSAVPIFLASLVFPCLGFRAPAMTFRGSTNSRGKIGTTRSLIPSYWCESPVAIFGSVWSVCKAIWTHLLPSEHILVVEICQLFICHIDAKLFQAVCLQCLKTKDIYEIDLQFFGCPVN